MFENVNPVAERLMQTFLKFNKMNWQQSPIHGLKSSEMFVLFCISQRAAEDSPGLKISEIGSILRVASPTVTQSVNSLVELGLVERLTDSKDRRAVRINLTEKGRQVIKRASEHFIETFNGLIEYLGEEKSNQLADLLSMVHEYFKQHKHVDINDFSS